MENKNKINDADISQSENAPARSEAELRYSAVFDQSPDGILIIDAEGKIVDFNRAAHTDLGYTREEFSKFSISDIDPVESPEEIRAHLQRTISEGKAEFEVTHRTKSGQLRNVLVITQAIVLSGRTVMHTIWRDITEQKAADKKVRYLASILEHVPDAICSIDTEGRIVSWNEGAARMLGYKADEIIGRPIQSIIPEEKAREEIEYCIAELNKRGVFTGHETVRIAKDDRRVPVEISGLALRDGRKITGYASIMRDSTERLRAEKARLQDIAERRNMEEALKESELNLRLLFDSSTDGIFILDMQGHFIDVNRTACERLGYTMEEMLSMKINEVDSPEFASRVPERMAQIREHGQAVFESAHIKKDGSRMPVEVNSRILDYKGMKVYFSVVRDITWRRKEEETKDRLLKAISAVTEGIAITDDQDRFIYINDAHARIYQCLPEELIGKTWRYTVPPELVPLLESGLSKTLHNRAVGIWSGECPALRKDGTILPVEITATSRWDETGSYLGHICIVRDITERKKAEEKLRKSEKQLSESQEVAKIGSWSWDLVSNTLDWSDETFRRFDKDPATFITTVEYFVDRIHADDRETIRKAIQNTLENDTPYHIQPRIINETGRQWVLEGFGRVERDEGGNPLRFAGTAQDITGRKQAEEALKESEAQFMELFKNAADAIFIAEIDSGVIVEANEAACRLMLMPHDEIVDLHHSRLHPPQADNYSKETFEEHKIEAGQKIPTHPVEGKVLRSDGVEVPIEVLAAMVTIRGKKCLMGTFRDITERKKAEDKIRQSEAFIRNILDTVDEGFIVIDRDFRILTANRAYCSQVGQSCDSVIGRLCYEISHKALRPCYEEGEECAVRHVFETGEPHTALHKHPDARGSILYVETKAFPIKDSAGAVISVIETVNNITEKHLLEEEQLKTQKLEAIGTLAGGIAHDFNNLLQGVFGYISMAKMTLDQKERSLPMLEQAEKALHMSVDLTTQLLTFSKGGKPVKKKIQLQSVIENSVRFALSGSSVDYRIKFDADLWAADADEGQIGQVVQNIVLNADQAMPAGGTTAIAARNVCAPGEGLPAHLAEGKYVEISVKDNGIGIPDQYVPRLFDPYFTTKEKGSGLGLATSYSIIKNHGGMIDVKSQLGNGSTFFVYLPALAAKEERGVPIPATADTARKGRVLVMDDEELVRNIVGIMLRALGHEVEFAENGEEAIAKYREALSSGRRFDVVILDLTVRGGMGGEEALRELRTLDPEIKAVVSSGYADSATISEYESRGFSACLAKPYAVGALRDVLNALLRS